MNSQDVAAKPLMSATEFALLGGGKVGYVREIANEKAAELIGPMSPLPDDVRLFALYAADGTPVAIAGSHEAAVANAFEHDLQPMSVH
ncbi:hypothetical protein FHS85_000534 [Rhodoligotrophos appendicifer]|uniref:DUF1150 family protein n=1 Tax=Rhodoligotrophos appendicifer TaxID=987056 RepID=UPI00117F0B59|nr:DUF1150 family protein [Rhodoligotrophos appendicifer]